jgi:hypothetical protein
MVDVLQRAFGATVLDVSGEDFDCFFRAIAVALEAYGRQDMANGIAADLGEAQLCILAQKRT